MLDGVRSSVRSAPYRFPSALALPTTLGLTVGGLTVAPGVGLGLLAVYVAILGDYYTRAAVNWYRFSSGEWKTVPRASGIGVD